MNARLHKSHAVLTMLPKCKNIDRIIIVAPAKYSHEDMRTGERLAEQHKIMMKKIMKSNLLIRNTQPDISSSHEFSSKNILPTNATAIMMADKMPATLAYENTLFMLFLVIFLLLLDCWS